MAGACQLTEGLCPPAAAVLNEDTQPRLYLMNGQTAQVKLRNVVPHDIGEPGKVLPWHVAGARGGLCQAAHSPAQL